MASDIMDKILHHLAASNEVESLDLAEQFGVDHQRIIGAIKSLQAVEGLVEADAKSRKEWILTEEGQHILEHGSHEAVVFSAVPNDEAGSSQKNVLDTVVQKLKPFVLAKLPSDVSEDMKNSEAQKKVEQMFKVGLSKALAASWLELVKTGSDTIVKRKVSAVPDDVQNHLRELQTLSDDSKKDYKKRKLIKENTIKIVVLRKGTNFSTQIEKAEADLTADLLVNDAWKTKKFKPINLNALGAPLDVGHLHPLMKVRSEFRKIFLEMGFEEMPTNNYVENSFWNFDALFQPQQHPARDAHDTFFISDPAISTSFPEAYLEKVKKIHSTGGYGSQGYGYDWKIEEAQKNLLRTHTTAVSARMLYRLMKKGKFEPVRYFSIDRVFRNETLDATHLAEFHQVEGVIADYDLTLGDLIGVLYAFFSKLGITKLEFKPAYNPYTEPSMEIFCFHEGLGKWIEIGNSGIFRPEMLLPMGLPENVNVIAWGLSLERPTMIKYGLNNIRDLVGPKVDLQMVQNNPLCRLDKCSAASRSPQYDDSCSHQERPTVDAVDSEVVMFCDVEHPPVFLGALIRLLSRGYNLRVSVHRHSSVPATAVIPRIDLDPALSCQESPDLSLVLIWTQNEENFSCLRIAPGREIKGQVNVARCLGRLVESRRPELLKYESQGSEFAAQIDRLLSRLEALEPFDEKNQPRMLIEGYSDSPSTRYFFGDDMSLLDVFLE